MNQTKIDWRDSRILVPNFRNGDVFYVIYNKEIVAIRLDKSYIDLGFNFYQFNLKGIATPANNNEDLKGDIQFFIERDNGNRIRVSFLVKDRYKWLYIYNSVEDARFANISRKVVDIVNMPVYTKGFTKGYLDHGSYNNVYLYAWVSWENRPKEDFFSYTTMMFYNDGIVFSKTTEPIMNVGYETEEEVYKAIKTRLGQYKVCTFEDEKKDAPKEQTISITIKSDMSASEILELIKKLTAN